MRSSVLFVTAALACAAGCSQKQPMVYVLEGKQEVKLVSSASAAQVKRGETVVLHLERRVTGNWQQIPRNQLTPGQCWLYTPPPQLEEEVADNVEWVVEPEEAVRFNSELRLDHTRIATMMRSGRVTLTPFTQVRCEKDRVEQGPAIQIEVT